MKKLTCLLLAFVLLAGLAAAGLASLAPASAYIDPDYERDEDWMDLVYCTEEFAYNQGVEFFKMWWIANHGNFRALDFEYCPPYYSTVLKNRRDVSYRASEVEWRILTFNLEEIFSHSNKEKTYVEGMLFNLLYDENSDSFATNLTSSYNDQIKDVKKNIKNIGFSEWKKLVDLGVEFTKNTPVDENFMQNQVWADRLGAMSAEFGVFSNTTKLLGYVDTVGEYIDGIAKLRELVGKGNEISDILLGMKNRMSESNDAYSSALTNFSNYLSDYMTEELAIKIFTGEMLEREAQKGIIDAIWDKAAKKWIAIQALDAAATTGKFLANGLTGIDDQYNAFNELEVYYDMEQLLRMEIGHIIDSVNSGNLSDAKLFLPAYGLLRNMYNIALDCYEKYAQTSFKEGTLNFVFPFINNDKYNNAINSAESMRESMKQLFLYDEVRANNAWYEAAQKYDPDLVAQEQPETKTVPDTVPPEEDSKDDFEARKPTFGMDIDKDKTMTRDLEMYGSIHLKNGTFNLNGHALTIYGDIYIDYGTFVGQGVIDVKGSVYQKGGEFRIPGGCTLTVGGDYVMTPNSTPSTKLNVAGGSLTVGGNLLINDREYSSDYAYFSVTDSGEAQIGGSLTAGNGGGTSLNSGVLRVGGNIIGTQTLSGESGFAIRMTGSGDARVENLSGPKLVIENPEGRSITFANTVKVEELSGGDMAVVPENLSFGAAKLQNDVSFSGPVTIAGVTALNGHALTVNGDLTSRSKVTANGSLTVIGSYTQGYEDVTIPSGGEVTISNNATLVPNTNTTALEVSGGKLAVGGGLTGQDGTSSDYARLTIANNGEATFGDPIVMGTNCYTSLNSGTLTVPDAITGVNELSGQSSCTVTVVGSGDVRVENLDGPKLVIENPEGRSITFANTVKVAELSGGDMTVTPENLTFSGTLKNDLTFNGNLTIAGDTNLGSNTLTVNGDLRQSSGTMYTDSGTLGVTGSYKLASLSSGADAQGYGSLSMTNASARVNVGGDMLVWTDKSCTLTNGVLTIGGHFTQKGNGQFVASGSHKTVLNGTKLQRVTFERTSNKFNILELMQYEEMYIFSPDNCWNSMRVYCDHAVTEVRNAVEATCTEDGYSGDVYCALCGDLLEQGHVIEAQGHTIVTDPPVDPTCETDGHTYGRHCSVCGTVFVQSTVIPALGHDWGDWVVTTEPTATTEGEETRTCRNDPSHTETRPIPATGALELPEITGQPQSVTTSPGTTVRFTVAAAGEGLTYQWQFCAPGKTAWNNSGMTGNKTATLTVEATTARSGQRYRCVVTNAAGSVESEPATLTVVSAPKITSQPQSVSANVGDTVQFTVAASGTNLTYQWQYKSPGTTSWYNSGMTGAKTATLTVQATAARNGQQYRCKVTNDSGAVYSDAATLTVTSSLPVITGQPQSVTTSPGKTVTFTVTATGADLTYQWQYQAPGTTKWYNSGMTGAKTATLTVEATAARNGQQYRCVVKNANGSVESGAAKLTVLSKPAITAQPQSVAAAYGDAVRFTVQATGGSLTYQWQYKSPGSSAWKDSGMTGNKTATLRVTAEKARNGQQYRCVIKNAVGQVISDPATLTTAEQAVPLIMVQPTNKTAAVGDTVKFTVQATGGNLTYQWQFKAAGTSTWYNSSMTGAKTATLQVSATAARSGQQYRCIVTNALGTVTSDAAKLTVK